MATDNSKEDDTGNCQNVKSSAPTLSPPPAVSRPRGIATHDTASPASRHPPPASHVSRPQRPGSRLTIQRTSIQEPQGPRCKSPGSSSPPAASRPRSAPPTSRRPPSTTCRAPMASQEPRAKGKGTMTGNAWRLVPNVAHGEPREPCPKRQDPPPDPRLLVYCVLKHLIQATPHGLLRSRHGRLRPETPRAAPSRCHIACRVAGMAVCILKHHEPPLPHSILRGQHTLDGGLRAESLPPGRRSLAATLLPMEMENVR